MRSNGTLELGALTRRAQLSTGALYHHFGSKNGLLAAVYNDFYDGLRHAIADAQLPTDANWSVRERDRTRRFVAYHFDDPLAPILLGHAALDQERAELESVRLQTMSGFAADNIRRGQDCGELPSDIDAPSAGAFIIGGIRHGIAQQLRLTPRPTIDQATERLWRLIAASVGIG